MKGSHLGIIAQSIWITAIVYALDEFARFAEVRRIADAAAHGIFYAAVTVVVAIVLAVFDGAVVADKGRRTLALTKTVTDPVGLAKMAVLLL